MKQFKKSVYQFRSLLITNKYTNLYKNISVDMYASLRAYFAVTSSSLKGLTDFEVQGVVSRLYLRSVLLQKKVNSLNLMSAFYTQSSFLML